VQATVTVTSSRVGVLRCSVAHGDFEHMHVVLLQSPSAGTTLKLNIIRRGPRSIPDCHIAEHHKRRHPAVRGRTDSLMRAGSITGFRRIAATASHHSDADQLRPACPHAIAPDRRARPHRGQEAGPDRPPGPSVYDDRRMRSAGSAGVRPRRRRRRDPAWPTWRRSTTRKAQPLPASFRSVTRRRGRRSA
jgi:hypothetical protein